MELRSTAPVASLVDVTDPAARLVASEPAAVVTSPVNAGKRATASVPVAVALERFTAPAAIFEAVTAPPGQKASRIEGFRRPYACAYRSSTRRVLENLNPLGVC